MYDILEDITNILNAEIKLVDEKTRKIAKEIAEETKNKIVEKSPRDRPEYYKGWKIKETPESFVIYNKKHPGLTHLLENGHKIIKKGKMVGEAGEIPHIRPAEEEGIKKFLERIKNELE